jgi:signal transduction histidine kinase
MNPLTAGEKNEATLSSALLILRWATLALAVISAVSDEGRVYRPAAAWSSLAVVGAWSAWLTFKKIPLRGRVLAVDVALAAGLITMSGLVAAPGRVVDSPLFANSYPFTSALAAGAAHGPLAGVLTGLILGAAYLLSRIVNGVKHLSPEQVRQIVNGFTDYSLAGVLFGMVRVLLRRASEELKLAIADGLAARERAARLAERERFARNIHDSVLQTLAMIHRRGVQIARSPDPKPEDVAALAELASNQEVSLRAMIMGEPDDDKSKEASLRQALELAASSITSIDVTVSTVGTLMLARPVVEEVVAAVKEALANVVEHAHASKAAVFADKQDGLLQVSIRDDGVGFTMDEDKFRSEGKFGVLNSMKGRINSLGGEMVVDSRPGTGTEVEFRIPEVAEAKV